MVTLHELAGYLDSFFSVSLFQDYCPNGIQIEGKSEIRFLVTAVSANMMTVEEAVQRGADALIVHHGIFWQRDPYPLVGMKQKKIALLLRHGVSLLGYHLPMDAHPEIGNNWKAAFDLKWENMSPFGKLGGVHVGVRGSFKPVSAEEFVRSLEAYYEHPATAATGGKKILQSAGLISGGAHRQLQEAAEEGLDCFITGNFDEPAWNIAYEEGVNFYALGHSATERVGPKALAAHLKDRFSIECQFIDVKNPF